MNWSPFRNCLNIRDGKNILAFGVGLLPYTLDNFRGIIMVVAPVDRGKDYFGSFCFLLFLYLGVEKWGG